MYQLPLINDLYEQLHRGDIELSEDENYVFCLNPYARMKGQTTTWTMQELLINYNYYVDNQSTSDISYW